ncbi:hypothetical protein EST38_g14215 [Candolleomyces aberdarensis]|uniref:Myb/SANT-like domain-containing protein n=1 Tax=Candolleomyces aberdarensis TaxID=2316362 RepID=A0A4Q2CXV4_9AGAR|nr:hypothetical protein EST38_g14215 [Candolleomyces aberdarensis]
MEEETATQVNAHWSTQDEEDLIDYLLQHQAQAGDGGSFKMSPTFLGVAAVLNPKRKKGTGEKTGAVCSSKWNSFKRTHKAINAIRNRSGWTWDNDKGANIGEDRARDWNEFIKKVPYAKPFRNKGWKHLRKVDQLMPATLHGTHVFSASQGTVGLDPQPSDPDPTAKSTLPDPPSSFLVASRSVSPLLEDQPAPISHDDSEASARAPATTAVEVQTIRKRERAETVTPAASTKKSKLTGPEAIQSLNQTFGKFGENICAALAMDPQLRTPSRRKQALKKVQLEKWLPASDRLLLYKHLESNINAVDAYASIDDEADSEFRQLWITERLKDLKSKESSSVFD